MHKKCKDKKNKAEISSFKYVIVSFLLSFLSVLSIPNYLQNIVIYKYEIFLPYSTVHNIEFVFPFISMALAILTNKSRSIFGIIINVFTPILVLLSFIVAEYSLIISETAFIIVGVLLILYGMLALYFIVKDKANIKRILQRTVYNVECIVFAVLFLIIAPSFVHYNDNERMQTWNEMVVDSDKKLEFDNLRKKDKELYNIRFESFSSSVWNGLSFKEKLNLMDDLLKYECDLYGMTYIELKTKKLDKKDSVLGAYDDEENVIYIDSNHLANNPCKDCINTILHEFRHYYQKKAYDIIKEMKEKNIDYSNVPYYYDAEKWLEAHENYSSAGGDYTYYSNELEADSREYAEKESKKYKKYFDDSGNKNENTQDDT